MEVQGVMAYTAPILMAVLLAATIPLAIRFSIKKSPVKKTAALTASLFLSLAVLTFGKLTDYIALPLITAYIVFVTTYLVLTIKSKAEAKAS